MTVLISGAYDALTTKPCKSGLFCALLKTVFCKKPNQGATMKKSRKIEIVIPTWEGRSGPSYWGDTDYSSHDKQSTSFWLSLRGVVPSVGYFNGDCRAIGAIGLYVWIDLHDTVSIDLRLHEVGSVSLYEGVQLINLLKRLCAKGKAYPFSNFQRRTTVHTELTKALDALGIKRALVYHRITTNESYELVGMIIKRISVTVDERLEEMKQRHAA
ncbi:MAG: hypothetical protein HHJ17_14170 [Rhodoferax sp.]|uniref:hypothetical protein n=1 Tax=Rhodoferax sp. TaxID=50421 RepID=UPI00181B709A|nr:hypothetical protein [Rhodoferax sp.]NMM14663.1 hypothetical protein [Rhodoferax sp.]